MADDKSNETPTNAKPASTSGAVKPPVLEGTARPAAGSASKPDVEKPVPPKPTTDKPAEKLAPKAEAKRAAESTEANGGAPWLAGLVGGVIGLGAAYGLAFFGLWPTAPVQTPAADPRVAQSAAAIAELQTTTSTLQGELATLTQRVGGVETSVAALPTETAPATPDSGMTEQLNALSERVEALANAPAADTGVGAENTAAIAMLTSELSALKQTSGALEAALTAVTGQIAALDGKVSAEAADEGGIARLPLVFSGLETAFATGRPYQRELAALQQALPDISVPQSIASSAATGLVRPDEVVSRFNTVLPEIISGRPPSADGEWTDTAADWFRGLVAMRPTGDIEGNSPDALVARLETALARRDFVTAKTALDALPDTMRAAAGSVGDDIAALAEAETFLGDLRASALQTGSGS